MATIVTRAGKGSPLTNAEVDANFTNLNNDKLDAVYAALVGLLGFTPANKAGDTFTGYVIQDHASDSRFIARINGVGVAQLQGTATEARLHGVGSIPVSLWSDGVKILEASTSQVTINNRPLVSSNTITGSTFYGSAAGLTGLKTVNGNSILGSGNIQIDGGVTSFNTRTGAVTLSSGDVTTALGFTPYNATNPSGYVTSSGSVAFATNSNNASAKWTSAAIAGSNSSGGVVSAEFKNNGGTGDANVAAVAFHCTGQYAIHMHLRADGYFGIGGWSRPTWSWYSAPNGDMVAAGNLTAYSDERLKKNWRDLPEDFVDRLALVKHGIYDRIDEDGLTQVGVSAQSLRPLMPNAVIVGLDDTLTVSYGNAALVSAVELAKRVVALEAKLAAMQS